MYSNLSDQTKFRLNEIGNTDNIKDHFNANIRERKIMSKKLSKQIAVFHYFDKTFIVLSATSGGVSIISLTGVIMLVGIASASFSLIFSLTTGMIK